jgi:hypothetical protein
MATTSDRLLEIYLADHLAESTAAELSFKPSRPKEAAAWVAEKVGR